MGSLQNNFQRLVAVAISCIVVAPGLMAASFDSAAKATNEFGLDLYRKISAGEGNVCLSPYSISCALAMTFDGAEGETRAEMARVLHVDPNADIDSSFAALQKSLEEMAKQTAKLAEQSKRNGGPSEPITLAIANRLFAQKDFEFRPQFLIQLKSNYGAPLETLDFKRSAGGAIKHINAWVAKQTRDRIRDLIPAGGVDAATRLVLANAIYLKAPWEDEFFEGATKSEPFHADGKTSVNVPMMQKHRQFRYARRDGLTAVALPYSGGDLQFVILLLEAIDGVDALERKLSAPLLADCAKMEEADVNLSLPKFKLQPPTVALSKQLQALGMKTAFNIPSGSANFDRMALRKPDEYLAISEVFHKTFIAVDEKGTEAAAATATGMLGVRSANFDRPKPIEVKVDRPFVYAIQHVPSGTCLFLGRVSDPR